MESDRPRAVTGTFPFNQTWPIGAVWEFNEAVARGDSLYSIQTTLRQRYGVSEATVSARYEPIRQGRRLQQQQQARQQQQQQQETELSDKR